MFDGSYKSRRNINLGGNRQQVDKQKLLRQAQEERRIREVERTRLRAAERIQSWYRGRTVAIKLRQDIRTSWDKETETLEQKLSDVALDQLCDISESLVQRFLIFFRPQYDHSRLVRLCNILMTNEADTGISLAIASFRSSSDQHNGWRILLARLLPVLLKHLGEYPTWIESDSATVIALLDMLTLKDSFQSVQDSEKIVLELLETLSRSEAFLFIAEFVDRTSLYEEDRQSVAKALLLSIRICSTNENTQEYSVLDQFITQILAIPLLPNRISTETLTSFTSRLPLDPILLHLSANSCSTIAKLPQSKVFPLVANILAFAYQRVANMAPTVSNAYLRVLTMLIGMIPQSLVDSVAKERAVDDDEGEDGMDWEVDESLGPSSATDMQASAARLDPRIVKWLSLAYNSNHLNDILGSVEPSIGTVTTDRTQEVFSSESIGQITQLLLNLITLFPSQKINILNNLIYFRFGSKPKQARSAGSGRFFGISIIRIFLDAFTSTALYAQLAQPMQQDSLQKFQLALDSGHEKAWSLLAFVSELYCQILITMGDDEFHDETRNPISLSSVVALSSVVRDIAFLLWWNDNAFDMGSNLQNPTNLKIGYLRDITTKLTRQLHARDSRKSFCPKDHWLLSMPLDMAAFKRAVIQDDENLRLHLANRDIPEEDIRMTSAHLDLLEQSPKKQLKRSQLARFSPRLALLSSIPFVIRFEDRVAIFREFVEADRQRRPHASLFPLHPIGQARIRRGHVFEDGFDQLNDLGSRLKDRISISFIDQFGVPEAGIDGGGVFKEFLTSLVHEAFDTNYGLFMSTSDQLLYPNPHRFAQERTQLKHYEFLGRILGKALYEGILVDAAFAGFFLAKCLGQVNYLDDLPSLDPELYRGLMFLKNYDGNVEDLSLYFTVDDEEMGRTITRDLIENGSNTLVTRENRIRYIYLTAHYRLNTQIDRQCRAFFHGLSDLVDPKWLWMFNQQELQVMLGGVQTPISLTDLEQNVVYSNFERTDPTIEYFWSVVWEMSEEDRRLLVKFVTSCARPPLLGFAELNPKLCIRNAGNEEDRLPTSSTCMNLLKLPAFTTRQRLKEKLLYAIHSEAGFDLS